MDFWLFLIFLLKVAQHVLVALHGQHYAKGVLKYERAKLRLAQGNYGSGLSRILSALLCRTPGVTLTCWVCG